jgi:glycosyltransferase involved in cell wall biosynthesis
MRVLNVLFDERVGGPQRRVMQVAQRIAARGFETHVVIPKGHPLFRSLLRDAGIPYHEMNLVRPRDTFLPAAHLRYAARFWRNVKRLREIIREDHIQIVHTNGLMHLQAAVAARLEDVPLVWHLNDTLTPPVVSSFCTGLVRRWADGIAIAAEAVGRHCFPKDIGLAERTHVLYAPVDTREFVPGTDGSRVRAELGIPPHAPVVGAVANLAPIKGVEYLLEAAPMIKQRYPDARFLIVGEMLENRWDYWRMLLRRRNLLGLMEDFIVGGRHSDMPEVYAAMTVFVQASLTEACPMAVMEASASGLGVVATDVGGTGELIENGVTGLLIKPRSPGQIADGVLQLLDCQDMRKRMGMAGAERMRRRFSLDACVEAHARVYESVIRPDSSAFRLEEAHQAV